MSCVEFCLEMFIEFFFHLNAMLAIALEINFLHSCLNFI